MAEFITAERLARLAGIAAERWPGCVVMPNLSGGLTAREPESRRMLGRIELVQPGTVEALPSSPAARP